MKRLEKQTGEFHTERINVAIRAETKDALLARLGSGLQAIGSFKTEKFITTDGYKYLLADGEWVAFRASGTEPLIRCYIAAKSARNLKKLRAACQELLQTPPQRAESPEQALPSTAAAGHAASATDASPPSG